MATYIELQQQFVNDALRNRVLIACLFAANEALENNTEAAKQLAAKVFGKTEECVDRMMTLLLSANSGFTTTQISNVSDATIQTLVDTSIVAVTQAMVVGRG